MKVKDYMRLGKISLKARKKSTRGTVRGISFGLILLMPLFFLVLAFYIGLNSSVDKEPSIRIFNLKYYSKINDSEGYNYGYGALASDMPIVKSIKGVDGYVDYNDYTFDVSYKNNLPDGNILYYSIDNGEYTYFNKPSKVETEEDNRNKSDNNNINLKVIDTKNSNTIFLAADYDNNVNPLVAGNKFSENPKNEIMVSSKFISDNDLDNSVVGKKLSLKYEISGARNNTTTTSESKQETLTVSGAEVPLFKEYTIVGIYDSRILKTRKSNDNEYFWMSSESFVDSSNQSTLPRIISITDDNSNYTRYYYFYQDSKIVNLAKGYVDQGSAFLPLGFLYENSVNGTYVNSQYLSFESYGRASNAVDTIKDLYNKVLNREDYQVNELQFTNEAFYMYRIFYTVFMYLSFALGIFGGVIFFATLLNLYNTINFSVQIRKNYLGLLRAVGMKDNDITKMYFFEIIQIFLRSYIWTIIFGGLICGGINFGFNFAMGLEHVKEFMPFTMSLNPIFILVAFVILAVITFVIALIFAIISCLNVSRKPILEVLVDDK